MRSGGYSAKGDGVAKAATDSLIFRHAIKRASTLHDALCSDVTATVTS